MAAAISATVEGWPKLKVLKFALKASELGESLGLEDKRPRVKDKILMGMNFVDHYTRSHLPTELRRVLNPGFQAY